MTKEHYTNSRNGLGIFQVALQISGVLILGISTVTLANFLFKITGITDALANTSPQVALNFLGVVIGWIFAIFILILEIFFLWSIWTGTSKKDWEWDSQQKVWYKNKGINIEKVISDENGDASMSRFQLLIFTFVVAMSLFILLLELIHQLFPTGFLLKY